MKKLTFIILLFIGFNSIAQINIEPKFEWQRDSSYWEVVRVITAVQGSPVVEDSVEYIFSKMPVSFDTDRLNVEYLYSNDSTSYTKKTKMVRTVVYRSRKGEVQRLCYIYKYVQLPNTNDEKMLKYLLKAKELGVKNNNVFWSYPPIDSMVHPEKFININDSIQ